MTPTTTTTPTLVKTSLNVNESRDQGRHKEDVVVGSDCLASMWSRFNAHTKKVMSSGNVHDFSYEQKAVHVVWLHVTSMYTLLFNQNQCCFLLA